MLSVYNNMEWNNCGKTRERQDYSNRQTCDDRNTLKIAYLTRIDVNNLVWRSFRPIKSSIRLIIRWSVDCSSSVNSRDEPGRGLCCRHTHSLLKSSVYQETNVKNFVSPDCHRTDYNEIFTAVLRDLPSIIDYFTISSSLDWQIQWFCDHALVSMTTDRGNKYS